MKLTRLLLIASVASVLYACVLLCMVQPWFLALIVIAAFAVVAKKGTSDLWAHGTARWESIEGLHRAGMIGSKSGMILGRADMPKPKLKAAISLFNPRIKASVACEEFLAIFGKGREQPLVRLTNAIHTTVLAPTGAGKGVSCIIPFLLTCEDSCVVLDLKDGELARITADARRKMGQRIILVDPYKRVTQKPDTLNPLLSVDKDSPHALDECRETAAAMVDRKAEKGDGVHFLDNAESAIATLSALVVQFADDENKSLQAVCDIVSNPQKFAKAIELMCTSDAWEGMLSRKGWELTHLKERELASTMTTIARFLTFLSTPAIAASTRSSTFDPFVINEQKTTVYFILPPEKATVLSPLLRLWTASMLRAVVKGGLQETNKVHFICDEANLLGKMNQISDALTFGRGFGLRLQLYYQDCGQLKRCWPDGAEQTLLSNTTQIFFGVNDNETAKYVSDRLGESTIVVQSHGSNTGRSHQTSDNGSTSTSYSTGTSENRAQQGRHLLKPDEVMAFSARIAITFTPGVAPVWTRLLRSYEDDFTGPVQKQGGWAGVKMFAIAFLLFVFASILAMGASVVANETAERSAKTQQQMFYP